MKAHQCDLLPRAARQDAENVPTNVSNTMALTSLAQLQECRCVHALTDDAREDCTAVQRSIVAEMYALRHKRVEKLWRDTWYVE